MWIYFLSNLSGKIILNFSPYSAETVTMQILFADHDQKLN